MINNEHQKQGSQSTPGLVHYRSPGQQSNQTSGGTMIEAFVVATVVGAMEIAPGICQMDLLMPDQTIHTSQVPCEALIPTYEPLQ